MIVDGRFVECGGRRFSVDAGNLFVVHFDVAGHSVATQIRGIVLPASEPSEVLRVIRCALPFQ